MALYGEVCHTAVSAAERIGLRKSFLAEIVITKVLSQKEKFYRDLLTFKRARSIIHLSWKSQNRIHNKRRV